MPRSLDEDDIPYRTTRTRPRSKQRPNHRSAKIATVTAVDRGRITCRTDEGSEVVAVKARELGRKAAVVGDRVGLVGDLSGSRDTLARLVRIEPRHTVLRRTADDTDPYERVIVANVDQMGIVVACADPPPRNGLIDRCLAAAYDAGVSPLLLLTKSDVANPEPIIDQYQPFEIPLLIMSRESPLDCLQDKLADLSTVLVGHSGVGKSTLINRLIPDAERQTGAVNSVTGRGRHTSTSAQAFGLPSGGVIIDTPGIRSFGLAHLDRQRIVDAFEDLTPALADCPRGCSHAEPGCALDAWVSAGNASAERLASLRRILNAQDDADD